MSIFLHQRDKPIFESIHALKGRYITRRTPRTRRGYRNRLPRRRRLQTLIIKFAVQSISIRSNAKKGEGKRRDTQGLYIDDKGRRQNDRILSFVYDSFCMLLGLSLFSSVLWRGEYRRAHLF